MTESKLPKKNVAIGSYGGITGLNEKTVFLKNGMVYEYETMPDGVTKILFVKETIRKEANRIFKTIDKIEFNNLKNDKPANMNFYIERNRWLREDKSYTWSGVLDSTNKEHMLIIKLLKFRN